jgi:hypothetical protein
MKAKTLVILSLISLMMASCTQQKALYNWGKTQETTYQYMKKGTEKDMENLLQAYQYVVDNQKGGRKTVPPGIYADYGFLLIKQGKVEEGLKLMKMEAALYPESAVFIERIIKRIEKP